jgi:hypothetical protein
MWIPVTLTSALALILVAPPLCMRRQAESGGARDLVFAAFCLLATAGLAGTGHFQGSVIFLAPAGLIAGAALALCARALGLPALALVLGIGLGAFGILQLEGARRELRGRDRTTIAAPLEARGLDLAAKLATRTADERVALCFFDGRHLEPESAAAICRGADVEAGIDIAPDDGPVPGHEALRAESAFEVVELPLFALSALNEDEGSRGFAILRPRPYLEVILAPALPSRFSDIEIALKERVANQPRTGAGMRRLLVMGGRPEAEGETETEAGERLRRFVRQAGFAAVVHPVGDESSAVRDGDVTWVGIGRSPRGPRPVRIVVEPYGVEAERLAAGPPRSERGEASALRFAGAWARRGLSATLAVLAIFAGLAALLGSLVALIPTGDSRPAGEASAEAGD